MKKLLFALTILASSITPIFAGNNLTIDCNDTDCSTTPSSTPLFNETNIVPGFQQTQQLTVNNHRQTPCRLLLNTTDIDDIPGILANKINIQIQKNPTTYFFNSLTTLHQTPNISLDTLNPSDSHLYFWTAVFDPAAGNTYQKLSTRFDLSLNFTCDDEIISPTPTSIPTSTPTSTPTPTLTPTPTSTPTPLPPRLNELMPGPEDGHEWFEIYNPNNFPITLSGWQVDDIFPGGQDPKLIPPVTIPANGIHSPQISISNYFNNSTDDIRLLDNLGNQVDIFHYDTYSSVLSWSRQPDNTWCLATPTRDLVNNPCFGIGGDDGQNQDSATPTPTSIPASASTATPTPTLLPLHLTQLIAESVLGEQITPEPTITPLIQGATTECPRRWLPILYILALLLNALYLSKYHQKTLIPFIFSLLAFLIDFYILRTRCCLVANWYCRWFWIGNVFSFIFPVYLYRLVRRPVRRSSEQSKGRRWKP